MRITHVLCPVDFSEASRRALTRATAVARWAGAGLTVLHVLVDRPAMDVPPVIDPADDERLLHQLRQFVAAAAPGVRADCRVRRAERADLAILDAIDDIDPDLLVMATHGRSGFRHLMLGSVTERVIRRAPCPMLIVPPGALGVVAEPPLTFDRVLCPMDFSAASEAALAQAVSLASGQRGSVLLLHVIELPPVAPDLPPSPDFSALASAAAAEARRRLDASVPDAARAACTVECRVISGHTHAEILREAVDRRADLIVMGVHGRRTVDLLVFGSTTHRVLRGAPCPVLIVHSENGAAARRHDRTRAAAAMPADATAAPGKTIEVRS